MTKFKTLRSVIAVLVTMSIFMTYLPFNRVLLADPDDQAQEEEQAQEQTEGQEPEQVTEQLPEQEEETPAEVVEVPTYNNGDEPGDEEDESGEGGTAVTTYSPTTGVYFLFVSEAVTNLNNLKASDLTIRNTNAAVDGYVPFALIVDDLTEFRADDYSDYLEANKILFANNSTVVTGNTDMLGIDYQLAGSSLCINSESGSLLINTISNDHFNGEFSDDNIGNVFDFFSSADCGDHNNYQCSVLNGDFAATDSIYLLEINNLVVRNNSTFTFTGYIEADSISIEEGSTLTVHDGFDPDGEGDQRFMFFTTSANTFTVNGTLNIGEDNDLHIYQNGSLTVGSNGHVVPGSRTRLYIDKGATLTGLTVHNSDPGRTTFTLPTEYDEGFYYDSTDGMWVHQDPGPSGFSMKISFPKGFLSKVEYTYDGTAFSTLTIQDEEYDPNSQFAWFTADSFDHESVSFRFTPASTDDSVDTWVMWDPDGEGEAGPCELNQDLQSWSDVNSTLTILRDDDFWAPMYDIFLSKKFDCKFDVRFNDGSFSSVEYRVNSGNYTNVADHTIGFMRDEFQSSDTVYIKPTALNSSAIVGLQYVIPDGDEEDWEWVFPESVNGEYAIPMSVFNNDNGYVMVDITTRSDKNINIRYPGSGISSIQYILGPNKTSVNIKEFEGWLELYGTEGLDNVIFAVSALPGRGTPGLRYAVPNGDEESTWHWIEVEYDDVLKGFAVPLSLFSEDCDVVNVDVYLRSDYELEVRYNDSDVTGLSWKLDTTNLDFPQDRRFCFMASDLEGKYNFNFTATCTHDRDLRVEYAPMQEDMSHATWTPIQPVDGVYSLPLTVFATNARYVINIFEEAQPTEPDYSFDVQYDHKMVTGFSYKIDSGTWTSTGDYNHGLGLYNSDVSGHTALYFLPSVAQSYTNPIKVRYGVNEWVTNPVEQGGGHWEVKNWTTIYADQYGAFAFPISELSSQNKNFRIDFVEDKGPAYGIVATGNNGGSINMPEAIEVIHEDGKPDVYMYNCCDFNETNVEINADQGYYINRITVKINNGTPVEITNFDPYRYNYKPSSQPAGNDRIEINVLFATSDSKMVEDVIDHGYAYHDDTEDVTTKIANLEEYLASEIYFRYFREGMYSIAFADEDALKAALTAPESISEADDAVNLPYAAFTFNYNDIHETFKVYLLNGKHDFLVKVVYKNNNVEYLTIENAAWGSADHAYLVDDGIAYIQLFGNGVDSPGAFNIENSEVQASQGTQETSGFDYVVWEENLHDNTRYTEDFVGEDGQQIGLINTRVILISKTQTNAALRVIGPEDCPGWAYGYIDTVTADSERSKAKTDYIFMANRSVTIANVDYLNDDNEPVVTGVAVDSHYGLSSGSITVTPENGSFIVTFNTAYDMIHLALEYSDGITRYITLHRIAVMVDPSAVNLNDNNQITIEHGTSIWDWRHPYLNGDDYTFDRNGGNIAISATYYYSTGRTAPTSSDKVVLFVTIRKTDGTTVTRSIRTPVKDDGTDRTRDNDLYNVYFDDFIVWAGPETEYHNIASVEIFAYNEGDGTVFGGVKAGSEHGYVWINDRDH